MMKPLKICAASAIILFAASNATAHNYSNDSAKAAIKAVVSDTSTRSELERERDQYRHPVETLAFFGIKPDMTIAEMGPGGGWYTRILAPLTAKEGKYIALNGIPNPASDRYERQMQWRESFINPESGIFGDNASARYVGQKVPFAAPNSVDVVMIIRGMHGQIARGDVNALLAEFMTTLKPGGVLGIVQHREKEDAETDPKTTMRGYVKQSYIIDLVEKAGFELTSTSEINANPKDTADWERGVWALQAGRPIAEKTPENQEIGESDRMTLKFVKPLK